MPRVPTYNDNMPGLIENGKAFSEPVNNVTPSFDYESVMNRAMQPMQNFAGAVTKLEAHYHDTVVKARADEQLDAFNNELQTTLYDPDKGYFSQQGKNAVLSWDDSQKSIQTIYNKHLANIDDPSVRQAFKSVALERVNSVRERSILYRNQQNQNWIAETSKAHAENLTNQFADAGFGPDSNRTMASLMNEIEYQGKKGGQSDEWIKAQKSNYASLAYAKAYSNMAVNDPVGAMEHFLRTGRSVMNPQTAVKTVDMLFATGHPQLQQMYNAAGGVTGVNLTRGVVQSGATASRLTKAQQGLGIPLKVADKVLNTSGYKGCNPLNVKVFGNDWQGLVGQDDRNHGIFATPSDGIRAGVKVLQAYSSKYGINTVEGVISRFAAAEDTVKDAYIQNVCKALGVNPDEQIDLKDKSILSKMIPAMIKQEIGDNPYSDETIQRGIAKGLGEKVEILEEQKLTAQDLAFNPDTKTGIYVIDNLPMAYKMRLMQGAQRSARQQLAETKNQLSLAIKNGLAVAQNEGDTSMMPGLDSFVNVYGQAEGVRLFEESQKLAKYNTHLHSVPTLSVDEMATMSKQLMPAKDDPMYAQRLEEKNLFDKACSQVTKQRAEDPIRYAGQAFPDLNLQPIQDWTNTGFVAQQLATRVDNAATISARFNSQPAILSKAEVAGLTTFLSSMDADHQAVYIQNLAGVLFRDGNNAGLGILSHQFNGKNRELVLALGMSSSQNGLDSNAAMKQIRGAFFRKNKLGIDAATEAQVRKECMDILPYGLNSEQQQLFEESVINEMSYWNGIGQAKNIEDCMELLYGKVMNHNGKKIILPPKFDTIGVSDYGNLLDDTDFRDLLQDFANSQKKKKFLSMGQEIEGRKLGLILSSAPLQSMGDGTYQIIQGQTYLKNLDGTPFVMNLNDTIEKRKELGRFKKFDDDIYGNDATLRRLYGGD